MNDFERQYWMAQLGYSPGPIDGKWGRKSQAAGERMTLFYRGKPLSSAGSIRVAVEQIIMREIGGLLVGNIDGVPGPRTEKARAHWQQSRWRNALDRPFEADRRMPKPVKTVWPKESELLSYFGQPGANQTLVKWPWPLRLSWQKETVITQFSCHVLVKDSLESVAERVLDVYGLDEIRRLRLDLWGGCLNIRAKRGGTALSTHAWGIAIDWDPERNSLRSTRATAQMAGLDYEAWWDAWTDHGWLSLGKARDFDWMHVQAARLG